MSTAWLLQRHVEETPFRAAIMQSGAATTFTFPPAVGSGFKLFSEAMVYDSAPSKERLKYLQDVGASTIMEWLNTNDTAPAFVPSLDEFVSLFVLLTTVWHGRIGKQRSAVLLSALGMERLLVFQFFLVSIKTTAPCSPLLKSCAKRDAWRPFWGKD